MESGRSLVDVVQALGMQRLRVWGIWLALAALPVLSILVGRQLWLTSVGTIPRCRSFGLPIIGASGRAAHLPGRIYRFRHHRQREAIVAGKSKRPSLEEAQGGSPPGYVTVPMSTKLGRERWLEPTSGFEPETSSLPRKCSTD